MTSQSPKEKYRLVGLLPPNPPIPVSIPMKFSWTPSMQAIPKLVLTAEDQDFDPLTIQIWKAEGFEVSYLPFTGSRKDYEKNLLHLADPLDLGEKYAIIGLLPALPFL